MDACWSMTAPISTGERSITVVKPLVTSLPDWSMTPKSIGGGAPLQASTPGLGHTAPRCNWSPPQRRRTPIRKAPSGLRGRCTMMCMRASPPE
eukprot:6820988-Pyramimonas_sp.AAC.1